MELINDNWIEIMKNLEQYDLLKFLFINKKLYDIFINGNWKQLIQIKNHMTDDLLKQIPNSLTKLSLALTTWQLITDNQINQLSYGNIRPAADFP